MTFTLPPDHATHIGGLYIPGCPDCQARLSAVLAERADVEGVRS